MKVRYMMKYNDNQKFKANISFYNYILLNIQNFFATFKNK